MPNESQSKHFGSANVPLTPAIRSGDFVFVSGQVPTDEGGRVVGGTIEEQTHAVLAKIEALLGLAGAELGQVVKVSAFLADARDFAAFNGVYQTYFTEKPPTRTTSESRLMIPIKVEIDAIAYAPEKGNAGA